MPSFYFPPSEKLSKYIATYFLIANEILPDCGIELTISARPTFIEPRIIGISMRFVMVLWAAGDVISQAIHLLDLISTDVRADLDGHAVEASYQ